MRAILRTALLCLMAAAPAALRAGDFDLEIITPHNEDIQGEFERAFVRQIGRPLKVRWIKKGTGQIIQQLDAQERGKKGASFDLDVFFGGGVPDHELAAGKGYLEAPNLPAEIVAAIPPQIAGVVNYSDKRLWYGSALSAFGVLINVKALGAQNLPPIQTWADLADPKYYGWLVVADPRKSSSVRVSYELILQQYGWEKGWPMLMQIGANSRLVVDSSSAIPNEVGGGNAIAGPCIDFYGYARVAESNDGSLIYMNPQGGSAITPDPISLLRKAPHRELAEKFIAFVLSEAGQKLWALPVGAPGGPTEHALHRMPIRRDVCDQLEGKMTVRNPYKEAEAGTFRKVDGELQAARNVVLSELFGAAIVDQHDDARSAWKAMIDGGMRRDAVEEWSRLPFTEKELLTLDKQLQLNDREKRRLTRDWADVFKKKFERVRQLAK